ncbi:MAG TPA: DUF5678 domain-containing protein [Blastocatellia bacterium]|nr:DUF5678 domain-containing protein [Blastocatellia bacterium]
MTKTLVGGPVRKSSRPMIDHTQDWAWINEHADEYRGQWVLVSHGNLVAADPDIRQLMDKVREDEQTDAVATYIPTVEEAQRAYL